MPELHAPEQPALTPRQTAILAQVEQDELVYAFEQVLLDRGIPLGIARVEFRELPLMSVDEAPSVLGEGGGSVEGGIYVCVKEGNAWVCQCVEPTPQPPPPPVTLPAETSSHE